MELLKEYFELQEKLFIYFGYAEDWRVLPMDDATKYFWEIDGTEESGSVRFAESVDQLQDDESGDYYSNEIYTQRHLLKWVYRGKDYTMICVDTNTDGNQLLQIFSNDKEI